MASRRTSLLKDIANISSLLLGKEKMTRTSEECGLNPFQKKILWVGLAGPATVNMFHLGKSSTTKNRKSSVRLTKMVDPPPLFPSENFDQVLIFGVILPSYKGKKWVKIFTNSFGLRSKITGRREKGV